MKHFLRAAGVRKRFGRKVALDGISLEIDEPGITVVLGPNGAGKSTLFACLLGTLRPCEGSLEILGLDPVRDQRRSTQRVGFVPDTPDAPDWMTPAELFRFLAPHYERWNDGVAQRMARDLGLPLDRPMKTLSRGEAAKAMLVAAFAPEPELVLLDEPFSGLDPVVRHELLRGFLAEFEGKERVALVATHDLDVAARLADRIVVVAGGRVALHGTVEEVLGEYSPARIPEKLYRVLTEVAA